MKRENGPQGDEDRKNIVMPSCSSHWLPGRISGIRSF
jgi:hypothetical protein